VNNIELTKEEKKYLWSKIEYKKKQKSIETQNKLYHLLNDKMQIFYNEEDLTLIYKSLEYTFRKKLMGLDKPIKKPIFESLKNKKPEKLILIKIS